MSAPASVSTQTAPPATRRTGFVATLVLLRVVASIHALLAALQPVWIGGYLSGVYSMLGNHALTAGILIVSAMLLGAGGLLYAVAGGRVWAGLVCALFFFAEGFQTGMGYTRELGLHIPLGVLIVAGAVVLAIWSWTPAADRPRPRGARGVSPRESARPRDTRGRR